MNDIVSIVIPAFNAAKTILAQLEALNAQSYDGAIEVIVADNGSSDATVEVARTFAERSAINTVVVDASQRRGPAAAVNAAVRRSSGDVILICNADDIATRDWVERLVEALETNRFVAGPLRPFRDHPGDLSDADWPNNDTWCGYCPTAATANVGISRELFLTLGGLDERFLAAEDIDLCVRAFEFGAPVSPAAGVMWYRQRANPREWNANLAWCVSWDIAVQHVRRDSLPRDGRRGARECVGELIRQFTDPRRLPSKPGQLPYWRSQTRIKWGRVKGHILKFHRLRKQ